MNDFNQDMQNLLNAYDSNWEDYLILREQFIEKYNLSVEKLQEQNKTMKLALVELSDENIYDNTGFFANEYAKNLVEQLDAGEIETIVERCNRKLQEQLNTAKYFFKNILDVDPNLNKGHVSHLKNCVRVMKNSAEKALAAIGNEGSGDE